MLHIFITRYTWNPHFPSRFWKSIRPVKKGTVLVCFSRTSIFLQKLQTFTNYINLNHEKMQNFLKPGKISRFSRKISTTLVDFYFFCQKLFHFLIVTHAYLCDFEQLEGLKKSTFLEKYNSTSWEIPPHWSKFCSI